MKILPILLIVLFATTFGKAQGVDTTKRNYEATHYDYVNASTSRRVAGRIQVQCTKYEWGMGVNNLPYVFNTNGYVQSRDAKGILIETFPGAGNPDYESGDWELVITHSKPAKIEVRYMRAGGRLYRFTAKDLPPIVAENK